MKKRSDIEWKRQMVGDYSHYDRDSFDMFREKYFRLMKKELFDRLITELLEEGRIQPPLANPWDRPLPAPSKLPEASNTVIKEMVEVIRVNMLALNLPSNDEKIKKFVFRQFLRVLLPEQFEAAYARALVLLKKENE